MDTGYWAAERLRDGRIGRGELGDYLRDEFAATDREAVVAGLDRPLFRPRDGTRGESFLRRAPRDPGPTTALRPGRRGAGRPVWPGAGPLPPDGD